MFDLWVVFLIIAVALCFDFVNGFHDAANSIATVVSTRVLSPRVAVAWAAFFNFVAFLFFGLHVARTIQKDVVIQDVITLQVIAAGLVGAIVWDLLTWYWGIPASSSHALVGGFAGAALAYKGFSSLILPGLLKITLFIFIAPLLGMILGFGFMVAIAWIFRRVSASVARPLFNKLQICSAAAYSLGHGGNDAQKTMGIIMVVCLAGDVYTTAEVDAHFPLWIVLACHTAMGLGTLLGGWRIVKTMGQKICDLKPVNGFAAETAGSACLYLATFGGIPVSTTHTITGAIFGVGVTRGMRRVRWLVARRVMVAWVLTIPAAMGMAMITWFAFNLIGWQAIEPPQNTAAHMADGKIYLSWAPRPEATRYQVYRYERMTPEQEVEHVRSGKKFTLGISKTEIMAAQNLTEPAFVDPNVEPGKRYVYRIRATNNFSRSRISDEFCVDPMPPRPAER